MHVHGQELGMADPRSAPSMAVQFVTESHSGRHDPWGRADGRLPDEPRSGRGISSY